MGKKLDEVGDPDMSRAVRPMALAPDERYVYFQVSFFHGFVEYDLQQDRVLRLADLPLSDEAERKPRDGVPARLGAPRPRDEPDRHEALRGGTMSDYAAIVDRALVRLQRSRRDGDKPYWATNSADGSYCFVSFSGDDAVSVDLVQNGQGDRPHPGRRPPAADADGQGPRRAAGHEEAAPRPPHTLSPAA